MSGGPGTIASSLDAYADLGVRDVWDVVEIDGLQLPGIATIDSGAEVGIKLDVKRPASGDGATITALGKEPSRIVVKVRIWMAEHIDTWEALVVALAPLKAGIKATSIRSRALEIQRISRVAVEKITPLKPNGKGELEAEIHCLEYIPSMVKAAKTPKTGDYGLGNMKPPTGTYTPGALGGPGIDPRGQQSVAHIVIKPSEYENEP